MDVRLIAATNKDLPKEVEEGNFREDLVHRLSVLFISVPPLRERKEDIPILVEYFLALFASENNVPPKRLAPEALNLLRQHPWPGNVRELRNLIERLTILSPSDFLDEVLVASSLGQSRTPNPSAQALSSAQETFERNHILAVLKANQWEMETTARALGIHRSSLFRKMRRLGIGKP